MWPGVLVTIPVVFRRVDKTTPMRKEWSWCGCSNLWNWLALLSIEPLQPRIEKNFYLLDGCCFHVIDFSYGNVSFFVRNPALSFPFLTMKQASAFYELLSKISHQSKSVPSTAPQAPPVQVFYDCDQFPGPLEGQSSPSDWSLPRKGTSSDNDE